MVKTRILVAIVFLPVFVWMIFFPSPLPFFIFCLLCLGLSVVEFGQMIRARELPFHLPVVLSATLLLSFAAGFPQWLPVRLAGSLGGVFWGVLLLSMLVLALLEINSSRVETSMAALATNLFGILLLGGIGSFVFLLRHLPQGSWWVALLFGFDWLYDAGALFCGRWFGRTPLAPYISPKKTVEGFIGGIVVNGLAAVILYLTLLPKSLGFTLPGFVGLGLGMGVLAQAGDLVESMLKRWSGIKDSAGIIPGHGGILDKFDSAFFNAPLLFLIAVWLMHA